MQVIHVLRKPIKGSVSANVLEHGTGAVHIDAARIKVDEEVIHTPQSDPRERAGAVGTDLGFTKKDPKAFKEAQRASIERTMRMGRWPANVVLVGEDVVEDLDSQGGHSVTDKRSARSQEAAVGGTEWDTSNHKSREYPNEKGGTARYFKQIKT